MDLWQRKPTSPSGCALVLGWFTAINPRRPGYNYYKEICFILLSYLDSRKNHHSARVTIVVAIVVTVTIFFLLAIIIIAVVTAVLSAMNLKKKSVFLLLKSYSVLEHLIMNVNF